MEEISEEIDDNHSEGGPQAQPGKIHYKPNLKAVEPNGPNAQSQKVSTKKNQKNQLGRQLSRISEGDDVDLLTNNEELDSLMNPVIYHRGMHSDHFHLIITGRLCICSGNEGFIAEKGTFEFLGEQCLTDPKYLPDFSCKVLGKARLLRISREDYVKAVV